jgi:2-polyprenyl-6-methoxyphenol hydroxylase-like FAD-dependent oxidoreductase
MPPQGESTGVAMEDAILLAHVFCLRSRQTVVEMLEPYEGMRREEVEILYRKTVYEANAKDENDYV